MKPYIHLLAIITEYLCMIVAAAKHGMGAAVLVLCAIIANSVQATIQKKDDARRTIKLKSA